MRAAFVRSPHAHAVIKSIDSSAAEGMPGVFKVLTAENLGLEGGVPCASNPFGGAVTTKRPILAEGKVRMIGEPIAIVVADSQAAARDAADRVVVDYDPLPVVIDAERGQARRAPAPRRGARKSLLHDRAQDRGLRRGVRRRRLLGL